MLDSDDIPLYPFPHTNTLSLIVQPLDTAGSLRWDTVPDRHTFYTIFWITSGDGRHHIDFTPHPIRPHTLYLMRPGQIHFFEVAAPIVGYAIFFLEDILHLADHPQSAALTLELFYLMATPVLHLHPDTAAAIHSLVTQLHAEYTTPQLGQRRAVRHLLNLLLIQTRRHYHPPSSAVPESAAALLTSRFQRLVDSHFATHHTLGDYAHLLNVTSGHLGDAVKATLGLPASHLIRRRIAVEAKRLLAHTDRTALEVSQHVGFRDSAYFGRFFKRETGHTPLAFRQTYRAKYHLHRP